MKQSELKRVLVLCHEKSGLFEKMMVGTFSGQESVQLLELCDKIRYTIDNNVQIDKMWINLVRNVPLQLEQTGRNAINPFVYEASEKLRQASVEYFYQQADEGDTLAEVIGAALSAETSFLSLVRLERIVSEESASTLIELLQGIRDIADSPTISRGLLAQLIYIPYVLFWNRHYFCGETLVRYDKLSEKIEKSLNYVLGEPVVPRLLV